MGNEKSSKTSRPTRQKDNTQIWIAIISVVGTIIVALIGLFRQLPGTASTPSPPSAVVGTVALALDPATGCPKDMVPVKEGYFLMGSTDNDLAAQPYEKPQRSIYLDKFCIQKTEVTVSDYESYLKSRNIAPPQQLESLPPNYPAVYVGWNDAKDYCIDHQYSLPTEAQWEKAARGEQGQIYPWGNENWNPALANCCQLPTRLTSVGSYPKGQSPYGALDMAGNAAEWVSDWYMANWYQLDQTLRNPVGPPFNEGMTKVIRGGDYLSAQNLVRSAARNGSYSASQPTEDLETVGFRCVFNPK